jgi:hypothetical protein
MFVKLKFLCNYPTDRVISPAEMRQMEQKRLWDQMADQRYLYEKKLYSYNPPIGDTDVYYADKPWQNRPANRQQHEKPPFQLGSLNVREQQQQLLLFEKEQLIEEQKFKQTLQLQQQQLRQSRIFCPFSGYDDITMYAMVGDTKHPDLTMLNVHFINNSLNGINATSLHSKIQLNETRIVSNHMSGLHIHGGAGDVSLYHCTVEKNAMNGINMTYAGGLKEFNYTLVKNNGLYGIYADYDVEQEMDNIFQNTTVNSSVIEDNVLDGIWLGSYCNQSNITVNGSIIRNNNENGIVIKSCRSKEGEDW